jgi:hypothetical protein
MSESSAAPDTLNWQGGEAIVWSQCSLCAHKRNQGRGPYCVAFQGGVPEKLLDNELDHRREIAGDGGTRFVPAEDAKPYHLEALYRVLDRLPDGPQSL